SLSCFVTYAVCHCCILSPHSSPSLSLFPFFFFFFNDPATPEIYTLSLHDALPIFGLVATRRFELLVRARELVIHPVDIRGESSEDRKSTRLNSSHLVISYAVFCLKKKKKKKEI